MLARALACGMLALTLVTIGDPARAETWRRWSGSVTVPTPDAPGEAPLRAHRCMYLQQPDRNEIIAWVIEIPSDLADGAHEFRLLDGKMSSLDGLTDEPSNFDVAFYSGLGTCEEPLPVEPVRFRGPADEHGTIPAGTTHALITLTNKTLSAVEFEIRLD